MDVEGGVGDVSDGLVDGLVDGVVVGTGCVIGEVIMEVLVVGVGGEIKVTGASSFKTPPVRTICIDNCVLMPGKEVTSVSPTSVVPHPYW